MRDKIVALADISMYTDAGDVPLGEILTRVYEKQNSQKIDIAKLSKENSLGAAFEAIVPDYDKMRVYNSDIKKLFTWYNILLDAGYTSFLDKPEETSSDSDSEPAQEETPAEEQ